MHNEAQNTGSHITDGLLLILVAMGGWISQLTMSNYIAFMTAMGGTLYAINLIITICKNLKRKKQNDGVI